MPSTMADRVVLVTGASEGIGAEIAEQFAEIGAHVVVTADLADEAGTAAVLDTIAARFGGLDTVVLAASSTPGCTAEAQRTLARTALPVMRDGGHFVFATNHQAHFFPNKAVPMGYAPVAAAMRAGETALYAMRSEFAHAGVHFSVVTGDINDEGAAVAAAVVTAATAANPSGVVCVGRADYLMTA